MTEKVSIIIPCYNYAKYLPQAIESAMEQTYKNMEIIVVDDGSTDNTYAVAREFPVMVIHQENKGLSAARNTGIRAAFGDWVFPLDADDMILSTCIEKCIGRADIVCPGLQEFGERRNFQFIGEDLTVEGFKKNNQMHASCLYRKSVWSKLGGYDELMCDGYEDWDLWLRAKIAGFSMVGVDEPLFFYRIHGDSMVHKTHLKHNEVKSYMLNKLKAV
jgi:glycosyltransferase involved in cell wall biosynthesis